MAMGDWEGATLGTDLQGSYPTSWVWGTQACGGRAGRGPGPGGAPGQLRVAPRAHRWVGTEETGRWYDLGSAVSCAVVAVVPASRLGGVWIWADIPGKQSRAPAHRRDPTHLS